MSPQYTSMRRLQGLQRAQRSNKSFNGAGTNVWLKHNARVRRAFRCNLVSGRDQPEVHSTQLNIFGSSRTLCRSFPPRSGAEHCSVSNTGRGQFHCVCVCGLHLGQAHIKDIMFLWICYNCPLFFVEILWNVSLRFQVEESRYSKITLGTLSLF